jgi:AcrR family transcriptional regulator
MEPTPAEPGAPQTPVDPAETAPDGLRPVGRAVVSDALVAAAERLFAKKGPDAVSLREIAAEADVNFGLLHRYIGTRDDLLRLVFERVSETGSPPLAEAPDFDSAVRVMGSSPAGAMYARMMAWAILEGYPMDDQVPSRRPATTTLLAHARAALDAHGSEDQARDARAVLALTYAFHWGWCLFSEHLIGAFELAEYRDELDHSVSDVIAGLPAMFSRPPSSWAPPRV